MKPPKRLFKSRPKPGIERKQEAPLRPPSEPSPSPKVEQESVSASLGLEERFHIATHEAGHAVAADVLGRKIDSVSIGRQRHEQDGTEIFGQVRITARSSKPDVKANPRLAIPIIVQSFAGYVAEKRVNSGPHHAGTDFDRVDLLLVRSCCRTVDQDDGTFNPVRGEYLRNHDLMSKLRSSCFAFTEELIEHHWKAIEAIAAALIDRTKLTGDEIRAIVKQHQTPEAAAWLAEISSDWILPTNA
jgi:hypothetical protein